MKRRDFIKGAAAIGLGTYVLGKAVPARPSAGMNMPARFYKKLSRNRVQCRLCPQKCKVKPGERGDCEVRENRGGEYYTLDYGNPCAVHNDPIEKKPLFHFLPGTLAFSMACAGCNIECEFCQNWRISQTRPQMVETYDIPPGKAVELARKYNSKSIAMTYTEPVIFYEYVYDTAAESKKQGLPTVMISNGYIEREPMKELCKVLGAVKIDFKAFSQKFYDEYCGGDLQPVLDTLKLLKEEGIWFEMVHLTIPTLNDSPKETGELCKWIIKNLGPDVPLHFTRFHPDYKLRNLPPTPIKTLERQRKQAMDAGIHYVYAGNVPGHPGENTYCHSCREMLIQRVGFSIVKNIIKDGKCPKCGAKIPGVWK